MQLNWNFFYYSNIGLPNVVQMIKDQSDYNDQTAPGVEMHCLFGSNADDTVERYYLIFYSFKLSVIFYALIF